MKCKFHGAFAIIIVEMICGRAGLFPPAGNEWFASYQIVVLLPPHPYTSSRIFATSCFVAILLTSILLMYDEADAQTSYAPGEFTCWCGGWITAYYDTNEDTVIEAGSVVIGMMDEIFLGKLKSADGVNVTVRIEADTGVLEQDDTNSDIPLVYFTSDISADGLVKLYEALGWKPGGNVAVIISTGEPPASNYLRPELIGDLVQQLDGTIVECNTAYGGSRASSAMHRQVAEDHGFTAIGDFDLMDEEGEVEWPVTGGVRLDKIIVGSHAENYVLDIRIGCCSAEKQGAGQDAYHKAHSITFRVKHIPLTVDEIA